MTSHPQISNLQLLPGEGDAADEEVRADWVRSVRAAYLKFSQTSPEVLAAAAESNDRLGLSFTLDVPQPCLATDPTSASGDSLIISALKRLANRWGAAVTWKAVEGTANQLRVTVSDLFRTFITPEDGQCYARLFGAHMRTVNRSDLNRWERNGELFHQFILDELGACLGPTEGETLPGT